MTSASIFLLPCFVSLIWSLIAIFHRDKTTSHKLLAVLLLVTAVYFYGDAYFVTFDLTTSDYTVLVYMDMILQFITLALAPLLIIYMTSLQGKSMNLALTYILFAPAVIVGCVSSLIYANMGVENASLFFQALDEAGGSFPPAWDEPIYHMQVVVCNKVFNTILLIEVVATIFFLMVTMFRNNFKLGDLSSFLNRKHRVSAVNSMASLSLIFLVICAIRIIAGRHYLIDHHGFSFLLSFLLGALIFAMSWVGMWFDGRKFTSWDLTHPTNVEEGQNEEIAIPVEPEEEPIPVPSVASTLPSDVKTTSSEPQMVLGKKEANNLTEQFVQYMMGKEPYLNPELSINDVAIALHTNRTYVSTVVNQNFGISFRDYINVLRINRAMDLLKKYPDDKLEDIAGRCGFASAAQFVRKFREITGETPRVWQDQQ